MPCSLQTQIVGNKVSVCTIEGPFGDAVGNFKLQSVLPLHITTSLFKGLNNVT